MDSQLVSFSCSKSNHTTSLLHPLNYPESISPDLGLWSTLLEWNTRRKIGHNTRLWFSQRRKGQWRRLLFYSVPLCSQWGWSKMKIEERGEHAPSEICRHKETWYAGYSIFWKLGGCRLIEEIFQGQICNQGAGMNVFLVGYPHRTYGPCSDRDGQSSDTDSLLHWDSLSTGRHG